MPQELALKLATAPATNPAPGFRRFSAIDREGLYQKVLKVDRGRGDLPEIMRALKQAFPRRKNEEGKTVYTPTEDFVAELDLETALIGGRLASFALRAQTMVRHVFEVMGNIVALDATAKTDRVDSLKCIIRSDLESLLRELSGEPRIAHVTAIFEALLGPDFEHAGGIDLERCGKGKIGQLQRVAGLDRCYVNTRAEDRVLTSFYILCDHVTCLFASWRAVCGELGFSTQLLQISRSLPCVRETVSMLRHGLAKRGFGADCLKLVDMPPADPNDQDSPLSVEGYFGLTVSETYRWSLVIECGGYLGVLAIESFVAHLQERIYKLVEEVGKYRKAPKARSRSKGAGEKKSAQTLLALFAEDEDDNPLWELALKLCNELTAIYEAIDCIREELEKCDSWDAPAADAAAMKS